MTLLLHRWIFWVGRQWLALYDLLIAILTLKNIQLKKFFNIILEQQGDEKNQRIFGTKR
jgi:hypothetical protein